jgi:hypothetical protein
MVLGSGWQGGALLAPRFRFPARQAQFTALRYLAVDGTEHESHEVQSGMIRRCIAWRNRNAKTSHSVNS